MHEGKIEYKGKLSAHKLHEKSEVMSEHIEHERAVVGNHLHAHSLSAQSHKAKRIVKVDE